MIPSLALSLHAVWHPSGALFVRGERASGAAVDPLELKHLLFAWHTPSFYGTFLETVQWQHTEGILIPPGTMLELLCGEPLQHLKLTWADALAGLRKAAPWVKEALDAGRFQPDFLKWKAGEIGWTLALAPEAPASGTPLYRAWIDALTAERVHDEPELAQALRRLEETLPALRGTTHQADMWRDEDDWLIAIGWKHDPRPFRTCLQLLEPEGGLGWRLQVLLQDRRDPAVVVPVNARKEPLSASAALPDGWGDELPRAAGDVQQWLHLVPLLREDGDPSRLRQTLTTDEAWEFLAHGSLRLAEAGFRLFLPSWWERARRRKPRLKARLRSSVGSGADSLFGLGQILQFDWRLAIGDTELTEEEFRELLDKKHRLVQFRGNWVQVDPEQLKQIQRLLSEAERKNGMTFRDVLELQLRSEHAGENETGEREEPFGEEGFLDEDSYEEELRIELELNEHLQAFFSQLERHAAIPQTPPPGSFHGSLRPYQQEGVSWLLFLRRFGLGGCLADDMGLGKTIQWITYLLSVKENERQAGPSLLICPTSVLGNWQKELQRFAPSLAVKLHYGPQREKGDSFQEWAQDADLVLTSYTLAQLDEEELKSVVWSSICLDEAQHIKNAYTKQAGAIRRLAGSHRIAMTGTPLENRLTELWSIFDFLNPGYLGSLREFAARFVAPIERSNDPEALRAVQRLVRPFLLRRVKKDPSIMLDLPDKDEAKAFVSLTAEQATLYENQIRDLFGRLETMSAMERRGQILASLTRLKQICNHPALYLKEGADAPWENRSNKVDRIVEMTKELRQEGDRCLIFTQFVESGRLLKAVLEEQLGEEVPFLHGGTPRATREEMIARFQNEELPDGERFGVFLLSLKAGGTGLNLTAASHVFHFDRWWNPAVENQATDRAYRIGQTRHVQVHKFVTLGTLEERIDEMIERKQGLSTQIVGGGEQWITELSTDELRELFRLRHDWVET
ncbi:ATP-dependent helicase [Paenibacillus sp. J31TS4]|uniref:DEAD/DEAH box helicase n=1 Tax=Paenibacillus sp. J31TS4 TaxID=2807195 RepID=UPI001B03DBEA|nr:DEAD/DEAH box helicase [Paenibacillus sp. J31TS4]GIP40338.1 ATP-dependent helicase [Paenibacillus sp. J31TS4]